MSDQEITSIINAITSMRTEVVDNFKTVFVKIDGVCERVAVLEGDKIARDAVTVVTEGIKREKLDWGKWFVRSAMGSIALGAIVLLWKLLTGSVKFIEVIK